MKLLYILFLPLFCLSNEVTLQFADGEKTYSTRSKTNLIAYSQVVQDMLQDDIAEIPVKDYSLQTAQDIDNILVTAKVTENFKPEEALSALPYKRLINVIKLINFLSIDCFKPRHFFTPPAEHPYKKGDLPHKLENRIMYSDELQLDDTMVVDGYQHVYALSPTTDYRFITGQLSPDGSVLIVASDRECTIINTASGTIIRSFPIKGGASSIQFSPNSKLAIIRTYGKEHEKQFKKTYQVNVENIEEDILEADGIGCIGNNVFVHTMKDDQFFDIYKTGAQGCMRIHLPYGIFLPHHILISENDQFVAGVVLLSCHPYKSTIYVFDTLKKELAYTLNSTSVTIQLFENKIIGYAKNAIEIFDIRTGQLLQTINTSRRRAIYFDAASNALIIETKDNAFYAYYFETGEIKELWPNDFAHVEDSYIQTYNRIASNIFLQNLRNKLYFRDLDGKQQPHCLEFDRDIFTMDISHDGKTLFVQLQKEKYKPTFYIFRK